MAEPSDFAVFLRSRRERISPEEVGLPAAGRRRTPGLRREELAALAGISVDYIVRLEQGRETNPSAAVLDALARTLRLGADEAFHLHALAKAMSCSPHCPSAPAETAVDATTRVLLDQLDATPAFVLNHLTDVLAWSRAYEALMGPTGLFDLESPNLLRYTFLSPRSREVYRDWDAIAREQVGNLRASTVLWRSDEALPALVGALSVASDDFARLWAEHDVGEKRRGRKELNHPLVGDLDIDFTTFGLPDGGGQLVVYAPADAATQAALDRLVAPAADTDTAPRSNGLRVVS